MKKLMIAVAALVAGATGAAAQTPAERLMAMDANKDGAITKAEAESARAQAFARADTNQDGYLVEAEIAAIRAQAPRDRGIGADPNKDGKISRDEFMSRPYRGFDRLDANKDGRVDAAELEKLKAMGAARKGG